MIYYIYSKKLKESSIIKINFKYKAEKFTYFNLLYSPSLIVHSVPVHVIMGLAACYTLFWLVRHIVSGGSVAQWLGRLP